MTEREFAIQVVQRLQDAGYEALWAGGCVRDELLGLVPKDYDVATNARPEEVRKLFKKTIAVGMSFGVIDVLGPRIHNKANSTKQKNSPLLVQVATFRSDVSYSDGRHPDKVVFSTPKEDALRRDFTINGMFFDPIRNELLDFVNGRQDLNDKILRAIGDPLHRFEEDKLRLLRAVRMAMRFDLTIEPQTAAAIKKMAGQIIVVSAERIGDELRQILVHPQRVRGLQLMCDLGLVEPILPELERLPKSSKTSEVSRPDKESMNLWEHTLKVLDRLELNPPIPLAFAALLHEIGQPVAKEQGEQHEKIAADMMEAIAERLRFSNAEKNLSAWLVRNHRCLRKARELRLSRLKRLLVHEHIRELLALHRADALAEGESTDHVDYCEERLSQWTREQLNPPPLLTGDDLKRTGLKPGPLFKPLLDAARQAQLDEEINTKEEAIQLVQRLLREWKNGGSTGS